VIFSKSSIINKIASSDLPPQKNSMEIKLISLYICVVFKSPVSPNGVTNFILSLITLKLNSQFQSVLYLLVQASLQKGEVSKKRLSSCGRAGVVIGHD
jgi:hypothetical protein